MFEIDIVVGKVSKPRRGHPLVESLRLCLLCIHMTH